MPLKMLIALVVGGIAGIAILTHLFGLSARRRFASGAEARAAWLREFPTDAPNSVILSKTGHAALVETTNGPGVVWSFGADSTARHLSGARVRRTKTGLDIRLLDPTAPRITLHLDPEEADFWTAKTGAAA